MHFETPNNEMKCVLGIKESNFNGEMGQNFHICLRSGPRGLTPPPLTISLTVKYPSFLTTSLSWLWELFFMLVNNSWRWIGGEAFHPDKLLWLIFQFWYLSALLFKEAVKNPTLSAKCDILRGHRLREAIKKHCKNCEWCPGHYLIVNHY